MAITIDIGCRDGTRIASCTIISSGSKRYHLRLNNNRSIVRHHRNGCLNGCDRFQSSIVLGHGGEGIERAILMCRRFPEGLMRGINGVIGYGIVCRGTGCIGTDGKCAAGDALDHKGVNHTIRISFIALCQKVCKSNCNSSIFTGRSYRIAERCQGWDETIINPRHRHRHRLNQYS